VTKLRERVRRKQHYLWRNRWILNQDNAKAHNALPINQCLKNKNITLLGHTPYSPDLAPYDFYLFPNIKSVLKRTNFLSVENLKAKMSEFLNSLTERDSRNYFEYWQHGIQLCQLRRQTILKAIEVHFLNLLIRNSYRQRFVFCVEPRTPQTRSRAICLQNVTLVYICNTNNDTRTRTTNSLSKCVNTFSPTFPQRVHD